MADQTKKVKPVSQKQSREAKDVWSEESNMGSVSKISLPTKTVVTGPSTETKNPLPLVH
jgi:hypothetical protein